MDYSVEVSFSLSNYSVETEVSLRDNSKIVFIPFIWVLEENIQVNGECVELNLNVFWILFYVIIGVLRR